MKAVTDFPNRIEIHDPVFIEMADGVKLAARVWRPADATAKPVPAILEFLPYRLRDDTARRDQLNHSYFAGHGYAGVRVDMRGSGDSDGVLEGEYLPQEQDDIVAVIEWLEKQPWCDGKVGMIGISWGGFNGLQAAARQPKALKAIVSICSTDDRYADDIHFMGGTLLVDKLEWASTMFSTNSRPPDPAIVGERWRELWMQRLEGSGLWLESWLEHQRRDDFYKQGSVCEDFDAIQIPVYAVGGWADGYTNAIFRLLANLTSPCKALVGPWAHMYPLYGEPGPAIGFLQECLRWWDHWLKEKDTGIMEEPALRAWMQDPVPPAPHYDVRPGRWVTEESWPSPHIAMRTLHLRSDGLGAEAGAAVPLSISSPETVGIAAGRWCPYSAGPDQPSDQRHEAGGSLVFDSGPLTGPVEILGAPVVEMNIACDRPNGLVAVCLSDLRPDGRATRTTYGMLNLTHRESHEHPTPLEPGRSYPVRVQLNDVAYRFEPGHRIRIALSSAYWPTAWPSPEKTTLTIESGTARLLLPERAPRPQDSAIAPFGEPEAAAPLETRIVRAGSRKWSRRQDLETGSEMIERRTDNGATYYVQADIEIDERVVHRLSVHPDDPQSARGETILTIAHRRGEWHVRTRARTVLTCSRDHFYLRAELDAYEGGTRIFGRNWDRRIARDLV